MLKEKTKKCNKINANAVGIAHMDDPKIRNVNNKSIVNTVGADATFRPLFREHTKNTPVANSNPNSKIQTLTSNPKGITLIALIITIIVMLILVGVTVSVALNGGLFNKANTAVKKTKEEIEKEQLLAAVTVAYNPNSDGIDFDELDKNLPEGIKGKNGDYTSDSTGNSYTVNKKTGQIEENKDKGNTLTEIRLGDKWTNVTFNNLPNEIPSEENGMQIIIIEGEENNEIWMIGLMTGINDTNNVILNLAYAPYGMDEGGSLADSIECSYLFGQTPDENDEMSEYDNSGWYYDSSSLELEDINWPINGTVVGIVNSDDMGYLTNGIDDGLITGLGYIMGGKNNPNICITGDLCNWITGTFEHVN